jgi:hypothetical protein
MVRTTLGPEWKAEGRHNPTIKTAGSLHLCSCLCRTYIEDAEMQQRLMETNPNSFRKLVASFLEVGLPIPPLVPATPAAHVSPNTSNPVAAECCVLSIHACRAAVGVASVGSPPMLHGMVQANGRGYWDTSEENLERLRQLYTDVEVRCQSLDDCYRLPLPLDLQPDHGRRTAGSAKAGWEVERLIAACSLRHMWCPHAAMYTDFS